MGQGYFCFLFENCRLLAFGVLTALLSVFGQTFYIGLFNPQIRETFDLAHSELGLIYGFATLTSAVLLPWLGGRYDRSDQRLFLTGTALLLALGCLMLGLAWSAATLFVALFLLRLGGQGLMTHIAMTTMAQRFHAGRGKAVSVAAMGLPLAEAVFPATVIALMAWLEWRHIWLGGATLLLGFLPVLIWLVGGKREVADSVQEVFRQPVRDFTRREVVRDWRFTLLIPSMVAPAFVVTIAFFHQIPLAEAKGWSTELVASGMVLFALGHMVGLVAAGPLVDRFGGSRLFVPSLWPLCGSMLVLTLFESVWAALLWPALLGLGQGLVATALTPLLAERYGLTHLGAIRAMLHGLMIVSTAVGPLLIGGLMDAGVDAGALTAGLAIGVLAAILMAWIGLSVGNKSC